MPSVQISLDINTRIIVLIVRNKNDNISDGVSEELENEKQNKALHGVVSWLKRRDGREMLRQDVLLRLLSRFAYLPAASPHYYFSQSSSLHRSRGSTAAHVRPCVAAVDMGTHLS